MCIQFQTVAISINFANKLSFEWLIDRSQIIQPLESNFGSEWKTMNKSFVFIKCFYHFIGQAFKHFVCLNVPFYFRLQHFLAMDQFLSDKTRRLHSNINLTFKISEPNTKPNAIFYSFLNLFKSNWGWVSLIYSLYIHITM